MIYLEKGMYKMLNRGKGSAHKYEMVERRETFKPASPLLPFQRRPKRSSDFVNTILFKRGCREGWGGKLNKNSKETIYTHTHTYTHRKKKKPNKLLKIKASPEPSQNKIVFSCSSAGNELMQ